MTLELQRARRGPLLRRRNQLDERNSWAEVVEVTRRFKLNETLSNCTSANLADNSSFRAHDFVDIVDAAESAAVASPADPTIESLPFKVQVLRGGAAKLCGQATNFALRLGFMMVLARLLSPRDFGLMAMVTVVTGFYDLFTSTGLSTATIQKADVSNAQLSTVFWVNIAIGIALTLLCFCTAPMLASVFHDPGL